MKKALLVVGIVLGVLAAAAGGTYLWLSRPVELEEFPETVSHATRMRNTEVLTALAAVGIVSALVDINEERAYIAYDLPANATATPAALQAYALVIAAEFATATARGIVVQFVDKEPALAWEGDLAAARALPEDGSGDAAYFASVQKTTL